MSRQRMAWIGAGITGSELSDFSNVARGLVLRNRARIFR